MADLGELLCDKRGPRRPALIHIRVLHLIPNGTAS